MTEALDKILAGIDKTESEHPDGWWETSAGAEFGARKKAEIMAAIEAPRPEGVPIKEAMVPLADVVQTPCLNCGKKPIELLDFSGRQPQHYPANETKSQEAK